MLYSFTCVCTDILFALSYIANNLALIEIYSKQNAKVRYLDFGHRGKGLDALGSKNSKIPSLFIEIESLCFNTIPSTLLSFIEKDIVFDNDISESKFYKVCIGAFKDKNNATRLKNEAISKGFKDTYII